MLLMCLVSHVDVGNMLGLMAVHLAAAGLYGEQVMFAYYMHCICITALHVAKMWDAGKGAADLTIQGST